jgi:hypothetical protein
MDQKTDLVPYTESASEETPKARSKALAKVAAENGIATAAARAMEIAVFNDFREALKQRLAVRPSSSPCPYATMCKQINAAVGIKSIDSASREQLFLAGYLYKTFESILIQCRDDGEGEKKRRAAACAAVRDMVSAMKPVAA